MSGCSPAILPGVSITLRVQGFYMPGLCLFFLHEFVFSFPVYYYVLYVTCLLRPFGPVNYHVPASATSGDVVSTAVITPLPFLPTVSCRGQ